MSTEDDHLAALKSQIHTWVAEIDELRCVVEQIGRDARAGTDGTNKTLREMRVAGKSRWRNIRTEIDAACASMKRALDKASSLFNK